jgi:hypothetical protein
LAAGLGLPGPVSARIEQGFRRRLEALPANPRSLMLVAAAEPSGDTVLVWRAAARLEIPAPAPAADAAQADGLLEIGARVRFRHPLVRSAVYSAASADQRRAVHLALAEATDRDQDPDRRAWHLAAASPGLDEEVTEELERSAGRAQRRGGVDAAAAAYVALAADGADVQLMAADHALRRELSRRIRDDLIQLGIVQGGRAVRIADGAQASPGDLIIRTRNDHGVEAGEPGQTLANGDLLRIEAVTRRGLIVRRALDADPRTGHRRWTDRTFGYANHADAELVTRSPTTPPRAGPCTPAWP